MRAFFIAALALALPACDLEPCPDCSGAARDVIELCAPNDDECALDVAGPEMFETCQVLGGPGLEHTLATCASTGTWNDDCDLAPLDFVEVNVCEDLQRRR